MIDVTQVIVALIGALCAIVTGLLIPVVRQWLQTKMSATNLATLTALVRIGVSAAEQIYQAGQGPEKKSYVMAWVRARLEALGLTYDDDAINGAVESAVLEVKAQVKPIGQ